MKKTFKKFLKLVEGSSCDGKCVIYKGIHILKSLEVLMQQKVSTISSFTRILESNDKYFVLDLKFLYHHYGVLGHTHPNLFKLNTRRTTSVKSITSENYQESQELYLSRSHSKEFQNWCHIPRSTFEENIVFINSLSCGKFGSKYSSSYRYSSTCNTLSPKAEDSICLREGKSL